MKAIFLQYPLPLYCLLYLLLACNNPKSEEKKTLKIETSFEDSLKAIIKTYPDSLLLKENLLQFYRDSGLYDKAITTGHDFINQDSLNPRLCHIMGLLYLENEDSTHALDFFSRAYHLYNNPTDLIYAGAIYARKKDPQSLPIAETLIKHYYDQAGKEAWLIKGIYYSGIGQYQQAISCFDHAIHIRFSFTEAYLEKAHTLISFRKINEAIQTLEKAVTINNNLPEGYFLLGESYELLLDTSSAIDAYEKTLMYDKDYTDAKIALRRLRP